MKLYGTFIGVDTHADPNISSLSYAKDDAERFYELIKESFDSIESQLQLLTNNHATKQAVVRAIGENLSRTVHEDDIVLLFFAGHGSPETTSSIDKTSRYLILYDTDYENIFATGLDMERELPLICFERIRAKLILLFVDACFSGRSGGRTFEGPHLLKTRLKQGVRGSIKQRGLELGEGRVIMTASDDDELAREDVELKHGVFTYFLLETLANQTSQEQHISIPRLYDAVSEKVVAYTKGRQHPILNGRIRLGRFPLLVNPNTFKKMRMRK